ncbi:MAG: hypothetical protein ACE37K_00755 [Planctomycetota bacterium]
MPESPGPLPIGDLVERYLEHERSDHGAAWCQRNGRDLSYNAREFASWLGESIDASTAGPTTLKNFVTHAVTRPDRLRICVKTAREKRHVVLDVFRWSVSEELLPASVHHALQAAKTGREDTRGSVKHHPVRWVHVRPVLDELSAPVTGARPSELFDLRPRDIDQRGETWKGELTAHMTAAKGHRRVLFFGAAAQETLRPLMLRPAKRTLFSPKDAVTPIGQGVEAARPPGDTYDAQALGKAMRRAVAR